MIELFQYIAIALPVTLSALGAAIGQSLIGKSALKALYIQPEMANNISKVSIIGIALTETTGILGVVITLMMLIHPITTGA
jgi:F0F1-type ATP synthase membrane subunit c/vacuolar-type H+-ATPase subunit K